MSIDQRIIHPFLADDGSVHYSAVMTPSAPNKSPLICPMVPNRMIPVIFVPGIMGSNLMDTSSNKNAVWRMDSGVSALWQWSQKGPAQRKQLLDPTTTAVDNRGDLPSGTSLTEEEMRTRGWGEVAAISYGPFLAWLETHLNDGHRGTNYGRKGLRAELMTAAIADGVDVPPLTYDEVATSYRYQFPVWAAGYNWLQSNVVSAATLQARVDQAIKHYTDRGRRCEKVILVTHSMGGLVARYYSEVLGQSDRVMGILHGVMPATGAATAYKRVKAGTEGGAGLVLGDDAAEVTAVFAQSPGALQLLPSNDYGKGWLRIRDHDRIIQLPSADGDPYTDIYLQRGKWWGLIDDRLLNPMDTKKQTMDQDWDQFANLITSHVKRFHNEISRKYHPNTYAFYGEDPSLKAWGDVTWKRWSNTSVNTPYLNNTLAGRPIWDNGAGTQQVSTDAAHPTSGSVFDLQEADEPGDGTVPRRSGRAPLGQPGVHVCLPFAACEHEKAYKDEGPGLIAAHSHPERRRFALWAITKIAYAVRNTSLAYR